jgi:hypothetical protein
MRPTKYNNDMYEKAMDYIANFRTIDIGNASNASVPTAAGLAIYLGVAKSTLYKWAEEHDAFSDTLAFLNDMQEYELTNNGLNGKFSGVITKLMLSNHGYTEKIENTNKGSSETKIVYVEPEEKQQLENHISEIVDAN